MEANGYGGYWLNLDGIDLSAYRTLCFTLQGVWGAGVSVPVKIEFRNQSDSGSLYYNLASANVYDVSIGLDQFKLSSWKRMKEFVITVEARYVGTRGTLVIGDISVQR